MFEAKRFADGFLSKEKCRIQNLAVHSDKVVTVMFLSFRTDKSWQTV